MSLSPKEFGNQRAIFPVNPTRAQERFAVLGEANWGSYFSQGLHDAAAGASGGAVAGAIGGLGAASAPGAAAGAVIGGAGGFLSGFLGGAATDLAYNFKSPQDKMSHMAGSIQEKLAIISAFMSKTEPQKATAIQKLGSQFKDYIDATVRGKENVNLSENIFAIHGQRTPTATAVTRFRAAGLTDTWKSSLGDGAASGGMSYLGTKGDLEQAGEKAMQGFAVDRAEDVATGAIKRQIQQGTGYLASGMVPGAAGTAIAGGAAIAPAAAGLAAGVAGGLAADWSGEQIQNWYYGGDAGRIKAEMSDIKNMTAAIEELTVAVPQASSALTYFNDVLTQIMAIPSSPRAADSPRRSRRFSGTSA